MVVVKFELDSDIRRVTVEEKSLTINHLHGLVHDLYQCSVPSNYSLKYKDDEGDFITVQSDCEVEEALRLFGSESIIRFSVVKEEAEASEKVVVHPAECDHCKNRICGVRWKCLTCEDYDLCSECKKLQPPVHSHEFCRLEKARSRIIKRHSSKRAAKKEGAPEQPDGIATSNIVKETEQQVEKEKEREGEEVEKKEIPTPVEETSDVTEGSKEQPKEEEEEEKREEQQEEEEVVTVAKDDKEKEADVAVEEAPKEVSPFEQKLLQLEGMGFTNKHRNITLLVKHHSDVQMVIEELLSN